MNRIPAARGLLLAGVSAFAITAISRTTSAQSVDYGSLEQLYGEPVTTSATGKPQKASEVPANMDIITQDDIRRSGADNIPDILQFVTGMDVRRDAFGDASVSVRGMNQPQSPRLLVLLNGRQVYQDDYGYVAWQAIPVELNEIRQIEIVRGPASALFGFNAVGGVVNIITYDPVFDSVNALTAATGTQRLAEGSVVATAHLSDQTGVRFSAGGYLAHEFENPYSNQLAATNPERGALNADGRTQIAPGIQMTLSASESSSGSIGEATQGNLADEYWRTNSVRAGIAAESSIGTLSLNAYRNELYSQQITPGYTVPWTNVVYVVQGSDIVKIGEDHTVRVGLEYRNNNMADISGSPVNLINGNVGYQVESVSAMWNWQITPQLSLTTAVRGDELELNRQAAGPTYTGYTNADYDRVSLFEPSYNLGLVYQPTDVDTLRLMAARGVGVSSLAEIGDQYGGNPNLRPTIVDNYELDYDRQVPRIDSVVRTGVFYQANRDLLVALEGPKPVADYLPPSQNIGSANEFGIEIGIKGHNEAGFRWNASYSFESVTEHVIANQAPVPDTAFDYMRGTPQSVIILGTGYAHEKWEFDVFARYQSEYRDYFGAIYGNLESKLISNYVTANARIGYKLRDNIVLALSASQFNAATLDTTAALPTERRIIASFTAHF